MKLMKKQTHKIVPSILICGTLLLQVASLANENEAFTESDRTRSLTLEEEIEELSGPNATARGSNAAFREGREELPPELRSQLYEFAKSSRLQLQHALNDTRGVNPNIAFDQLVMKVCDVVNRSYDVSRGTELLMRIALADSLKIVWGLTADGRCERKSKGPYLSHQLLWKEKRTSSFNTLRYQILKDTVEFAISLAETDMEVRDRVGASQSSPGMLDLPYEEFAYYRLLVGAIWNSSVTLLGSRMEYVMLRSLFVQWRKTLINENEMNWLASGKVIVRTEDVLRETKISKDLSLKSAPSGAKFDEVLYKTRRLRRHLSEMIAVLSKRIDPNDTIDTERAESVIGAYKARFDKNNPATTQAVTQTQ